MPSSAGVAECSGIVSIWHSSRAEAAAFTADAECVHPGRFLLGLGTSHAVLVEGKGTHYRKPYSTMVEYINALDAAGLAPERRILAALGPRMLQLSRDRSAGAHPYFTAAALIPRGTVEQVAAGIEKHYRVGADEVAIQVLNGGDATMFRDGAGLIRSRPYRFDGRARKAPSAVAYPKNFYIGYELQISDTRGALPLPGCRRTADLQAALDTPGSHDNGVDELIQADRWSHAFVNQSTSRTRRTRRGRQRRGRSGRLHGVDGRRREHR